MSRSRKTVSGVALVLAMGLLLLSIAPAALALGYTQWVHHGIAVVPDTTSKYTPQACISGNGAILVWGQGTAPNTLLYAAKLNSNGTVAWDDVVVAPGGWGTQDKAQICPDGGGGAYIVWQDNRSTNWDIYAQRINSSGVRLWNAAGVRVDGGPVNTQQRVPQILQNNLLGCIISWNDNRSGGVMPYAQKLDTNGAPLWDVAGKPLCNVNAAMNGSDEVKMTKDNSGGALFTWPDNRNGNPDIYANGVNSVGTLYTGAGEVVCNQTSAQFEPQIVFSDMAGAIITWTDLRNGHNDIYGQRVDGDFTRYWGANGMPVCVNERNKDDIRMCSDMQAGALLTWQDDRPLGDVRAQRLDRNGVVRWASEGVSICTGDFNKWGPQITNDSFAGAIVCWYDRRSGHDTVYAQKLDAAGNILDVQNGKALSDESLPLSSPPGLCTDGVGGVIATWVRGDQWLMAQRIDYNYDYYFAEGNTRTGFAEYVCLGNPTGETVTAVVFAIFNDGTAPVGQNITVDPASRATVFVPTLVGAGNLEKDVSIRITADRQLICERPMYFNYGGSWTGGSDAMAATSPSETWYFAEGNTLPGFEEWICVLNTTGTVANLTFRFQDQVSGAVRDGVVLPYSRASFRVNDLLGAGYQASLKLESDQPVVAERSMYFNYLGMAGSLNWTGGTCVTGATQLNRAYYFAEGTTRFASNALFEEWLTLQNPSATDITVDAAYQLESGPPVTKSYPVPANQRLTIFVPTEVGFQHDVSVKLTSTSDFLAERPMYFDYLAYGADWTGGSCVIGAAAPGNLWCFGEGATIADFHEYLTLQNPGTTDATVQIVYFPEGATSFTGADITVPANSRRTVFVNSDAGQGLQLSAAVRVTTGSEIIVERPMYFNYAGWTGGHDALGGYVFAPGA